MKHLILMSKVSGAAHINHILKVVFLFVDSGIMLEVHTEYLLREIPPMETGCSSSFEDGSALGFGIGGCLSLVWCSLNGLI